VALVSHPSGLPPYCMFRHPAAPLAQPAHIALATHGAAVPVWCVCNPGRHLGDGTAVGLTIAPWTGALTCIRLAVLWPFLCVLLKPPGLCGDAMPDGFPCCLR